MPQRCVLMFHAQNRPGIIAAITTALAELGGDMFEASQTVVNEHLTMIIAANFPDHRQPEVIIQHLSDAGRAYGLSVSFAPRVESQAPKSRDTSRMFLHLSGKDAPGLLRGICAFLAGQNVDILDLRARKNEDSTNFEATLELDVPTLINAFQLQHDLDDWGFLNGLHMQLFSKMEMIPDSGVIAGYGLHYQPVS